MSLLPCPFCGLTPTRGITKLGFPSIQCETPNCLLSEPIIRYTERRLTSDWNTRGGVRHVQWVKA